MKRGPGPFASWLNATMQSRNLSQAELARVVGVADTQISRWRRGQVVPTVRYLQRIADSLRVPRADLDRLAGYPVGEVAELREQEQHQTDPQTYAELQAYQARFGELLQQKLPPHLWRTYAEACEALAGALAASFHDVLGKAQENAVEEAEPAAETNRRQIGFKA